MICNILRVAANTEEVEVAQCTSWTGEWEYEKKRKICYVTFLKQCQHHQRLTMNKILFKAHKQLESCSYPFVTLSEATLLARKEVLILFLKHASEWLIRLEFPDTVSHLLCWESCLVPSREERHNCWVDWNAECDPVESKSSHIVNYLKSHKYNLHCWLVLES